MQEICTCADLVRYIQEWGFVPLFKNEIPGFSVEEHTPPELWFADDADGPWEWKGPAIRQSGCAYGKFFRNKAVFIRSDWFLDFANYRRDGYDFDARCDEGLAPHADRLVYDTLSRYPSMLSKDLKRQSGFGKDGRKGFDQILTRLQMQGYIVTTNFEYQQDKHGKTYGWGVARYATPEQHFGASFCDAVYSCEPEGSRERIYAHLRALFPKTEEKTLRRLIG